MSYEGWEQGLCAGGHSHSWDCFDDPPKACHCGAELVWYNSVNTTNGSYGNEGERIDGYIELEVKTPAITHTCSCGNQHHSKEPTYHIPAKDVGKHDKPRGLYD